MTQKTLAPTTVQKMRSQFCSLVPLFILFILTLSVSSQATFTAQLDAQLSLNLLPTVSITFSEAQYPIIFTLKIGIPSFFGTDSWKYPQPAIQSCKLRYGSTTSPDLMYNFAHLSTGMISPSDSITHDRYQFNLATAPALAPAETVFTFQCEYLSLLTLPITVSVTQTPSNIPFWASPVVFFTAPRNAPHNAKMIGAFAVTADPTTPTTFSLYISNLESSVDDNLWASVGFRVTAAAGLAYSPLATAYTSTGSSPVDFAVSLLAGGGLSFSGQPPKTIAIGLDFTAASSISTISFGLEFAGIPALSPLETISLYVSPLPIQLTAVSLTDRADNEFRTVIPVPEHRELIYSWDILPQSSPPGLVQTLTISPPPLFQNILSFVSCTLENAIDTPTYTRSFSSYVITATISPDTGSVLTCVAIFDDIFAFPDFIATPTHLFAVNIFSSIDMRSTAQYTSTIPWLVTGLALIPPPAIDPAATLIPPTLLPTNFAYLDHPPKWYVSGFIPGAYAPTTPVIIGDHMVRLSNPLASGSTGSGSFGWIEDGSNAFGLFSLSPTIVSSNDYGYSISFSSRPGSTLVDPFYQFQFEFSLDSFPTTATPTADFRLTQAGNIGVQYRFDYSSQSVLLSNSHYPIAHLPDLALSCEDDGAEFDPTPATPWINIEVRIPLKAYGFPTDIANPIYLTGSVWKSPSDQQVVLYTGTQLTFALNCNRCQQVFGTIVQSGWLISLIVESASRALFSAVVTSTTPVAITTESYFFTIPVSLTNRQSTFSIEIETVQWTFISNPPVPIARDRSFQFSNRNLATAESTTIKFQVPSPTRDIAIPRLVENGNQQLATKPVITMGPGVGLYAAFSPGNPGPLTQAVELWYFGGTPAQQRRIRLIASSTPFTSTNLNFPGVNGVITNAFLKLIYPNPTSSTLPPSTQDTIYFDIIPNCMKVSTMNLGEFESACTGASEICVMTTGVCTTLPPPTTPGGGDDDDSPLPQKCPRCSQTTTKSCTPADQENNRLEVCLCQEGWEGPTCQVAAKCSGTNSKCLPTNGFNIVNLDDTCSSTCQCYNQWSGKACQSCALQCFNGGIAYNDCARCGCSAGFRGLTCQCRSVQASLTLNGFNNIVDLTKGKLSTAAAATQQSFHFDHSLLLGSFVLPNGSTQNDLELYSVLKELYQSFQVPLTTTSSGTFILSLEPISTSSKTKFSFTVLFNCPDNNPTIQTQEQLNLIWSEFVAGFTNIPAVKKHFNFPTEPQVTETDLEKTPEALPPDNERLSNGIGALFGTTHVLLLVVGMVFFFSTTDLVVVV